MVFKKNTALILNDIELLEVKGHAKDWNIDFYAANYSDRHKSGNTKEAEDFF